MEPLKGSETFAHLAKQFGLKDTFLLGAKGLDKLAGNYLRDFEKQA